jgi:cytochrome c biogenesis protein CcmG/thiol:disulfide interchange protein DsbE
MKNLVLLSLIFSAVLFSFTPVLSKFPTLNLKTLDGKACELNQKFSKNKLTVVSFWATWCSPCKKELDAMSSHYSEWQKRGIEVIAVTIDDIQQVNKVKPMVQQKSWGYTILSDVNKDSLKKLGFQSIPQTFVIDANGQILYTHSGYTPGDEHELEKKLLSFL